jgi:hypothetical protein
MRNHWHVVCDVLKTDRFNSVPFIFSSRIILNTPRFLLKNSPDSCGGGPFCSPITIISPFQAFVQEIIDTNPFSCTSYCKKEVNTSL